MNILSISVDDLNAYATLKSLYGSTLHTPNMDRLAEAGTVFENAFAQVALCNPSRTSILSGQYPSETGVHANTRQWYDSIDPALTLPALLKDAGNEVGIFGKVFHVRHFESEPVVADRVQNVRDGFNIGETPFIGTFEGRPEAHGDYVNTSAAIDMLESVTPGDPFAIVLGIYRPHMDWVVPPEYFEMYDLDTITRPWGDVVDETQIPAFIRSLRNGSPDVLSGAPEFGWQEAIRGYLASISFADAQIGRMLDALDASPHAQDTAVVLWSDHGYHLGDHNVWHKFTLWEEAARAPLIVSVPGMEAGRVSAPVELVDIFPTVMQLAGLDVPDFASGRSLLPFLEDPAYVDGKPAITTMYGSVAMRTEQYRMIRYEDGSTELYDIIADPFQHMNLALDPAQMGLHDTLMDQMLVTLEAQGWRFVDEGHQGDATDNIIVAGETSTAIGGAGDDTYFASPLSTIREDADGGNDVVFMRGGGIVPLNVETAYLYDVGNRQVTIIGNHQNNVIVGAMDIFGYGGDDVLRGHGSLFGGAGDDYLIGGGTGLLGREEALFGGMGNDTLDGSRGDDELMGQSGNDLLLGGAGRDIVNGGAGDDALFGQADEDHLRGGAGNDIVSGASGDDRIAGGGGNDSLNGGSGSDVISGGMGDDLIRGSSGNDTVLGGNGRDTIFAGEGDDVIREFIGGNVIRGNDGNDTVIYMSTASVTVDLTAGLATAGSWQDRLFDIENIGAGSGDDRLFGDTSDNTFFGRAGDDVISGGGGNNMLYGNGGADVFLIRPVAGMDVVGDFAIGTDRLDVSGLEFDTYALLESEMTETGAGVRFEHSEAAGSVLLTGVTLAQLDEASFIF